MKSTSLATVAFLTTLQVFIAGCGGDSGSTPVAPPSITAQPADASVITGSGHLHRRARRPTYQWRKNGVDISGAVASSYTTPAAASDDGAVYTVAVTNSVATVVSSSATLHLKLSDDQAVFEGTTLGSGAGSYEFDWKLNPDSASVQVANTDWLQTDFGQLSLSPLTHGPQSTTQSTPVALTATLPVVSDSPTRVLVNGAILVAPGINGKYAISYNNSAIQDDALAQDGVTVAYSQLRSGYAAHALSGALSTTPPEFALPYNAIFTNTSILDQTPDLPGGRRVRRLHGEAERRPLLGDRLPATTTGNAPSPCNSSTTLDAAMTAGETSNSDGTTYHLADGTVATIGGVPVWIATTPRPASSVGRSTVEYRIYFQLNGNVYTGALTKDGTVIGGGHYPGANGTVYVDYQVRLNKAARDSIAAAVKF